ncbi:MAG: hypothetical protein NXI00_23710, partial [Cytophagales bacterium]|nr:hypothetical protein [Cytophagales bacterium]
MQFLRTARLFGHQKNLILTSFRSKSDSWVIKGANLASIKKKVNEMIKNASAVDPSLGLQISH